MDGKLIGNRKIGAIDISAVALGTMRFADKQISKEEIVDLLSFLYHDAGINVHHSSHEYISYTLYCEALKQFKKKSKAGIRHICKLSAPDFKEDKFLSSSLINRVKKELVALDAEHIDMVQWLYRTEPVEDEKRLKGLWESTEEIEYTFAKLIKEGLIGVVGTFPYSVSFGVNVSKTLESVSGWITYFNLMEPENLLNLPEGNWMIGIRPLAAGKIYDVLIQLKEKDFDRILPPSHLAKKEKIVQFCLSYCLMQEKVKTNILSINSLEQAKSIHRIIQRVAPVDSDKILLAAQFLKQ